MEDKDGYKVVTLDEDGVSELGDFGIARQYTLGSIHNDRGSLSGVGITMELLMYDGSSRQVRAVLHPGDFEQFSNDVAEIKRIVDKMMGEDG